MQAKKPLLLGVFLPALLLVAPIVGAAPQAPVPSPVVGARVAPIAGRPILQVKQKTDLTLTKGAGVPGEKKTFEAVLKAGETPVAGKTVNLTVEGGGVPDGKIELGNAVTDNVGMAKITVSLPELAQGSYTLKARFTGDDERQASSADASLLMVKGQTKIELSNLMWGTYKNEGGTPYGTISLKLLRTSDGNYVDRATTITVNGKSWPISNSGYAQIPLPTNAATWHVKVQFDGDGVYLATAAEKTYQKPN